MSRLILPRVLLALALACGAAEAGAAVPKSHKPPDLRGSWLAELSALFADLVDHLSAGASAPQPPTSQVPPAGSEGSGHIDPNGYAEPPGA